MDTRIIRRVLLPLLIAAAFAVAAGLLLSTGRAEAAPPGQELGRRVAAVGDGRARFHFPVAEDVHVQRRVVDGGLVVEEESCPWLGVELRLDDGSVRGLEVYTCWSRPRRPDAEDLGEVGGREAAAWLLSVARTTRSDDVGEEAVSAASMAADADPGPALLALARDRSRGDDTRSSALLHAGRLAGEKAASGLAKIVEDDDEGLKLRETAVMALAQLPEEKAVPLLIRISEENPHPQLRSKALFWMGQMDSPEVLAHLEKVITGG